MKVSELIEELKKYDWETELYVNDAEYWPCKIQDIEDWIRATFQNNHYSIWYWSDLERLPEVRKNWLDFWDAVISEKKIIIFNW